VFVELKYHGEDVLIRLIYNLPGLAGLQIYQPILEDLYPRYIHCLLLGDLNASLIANTARTMDLKLQLESVLLSIVSSEPTNFTVAEPTLLDICASRRDENVFPNIFIRDVYGP
jgi:hypothetical protein